MSAKWKVYWPGQEVITCDYHKRALEELGRIMGLQKIASESILDCEGLWCINCVNHVVSIGKEMGAEVSI